MAQNFHTGKNIVATGVTLSTSGASSSSAIPVNSSGNIPNYVRIASRNEAYVKVGTSGVVATSNDILVQPADCVVLFIPKGITHVAAIQGVSAGVVNISPLENS